MLQIDAGVHEEPQNPSPSQTVSDMTDALLQVWEEIALETRYRQGKLACAGRAHSSAAA